MVGAAVGGVAVGEGVLAFRGGWWCAGEMPASIAGGRGGWLGMAFAGRMARQGSDWVS